MTDRQVKMVDLRDSFKNERTYNNYRAVLAVVNSHYSWTLDVVFYDRMDNRAKEIAELLHTKYRITSTDHFRQKVSIISSLMTRTGFGKDHRIAVLTQNAGSMLSVAKVNKDSLVEEWESLQPKLVELGKESSVVGIIARIFSYGYVLRVGEIFTTRIKEDNGKDNYLDLENCIWYVRNQKNGLAKTFKVHQELCDSLKGLTSEWLLCKADGSKFSPSCQRLPYHGWKLASNTDIRKSYETWNCANKDRSESEKEKWHEILGHSRNTVKAYYDTKVFDSRIRPIIRLKSTPKPI